MTAGIMMLTSSLFAIPVFAATDRGDISAGMKTLPLLTNKMAGTVKLAIVFDPANPASKQEAYGIKAILDSGFEAPGDLQLIGILVPVNGLGGMAGSRIAVLTNGLNAHYDSISTAAAAYNILTMSTDLGCVQNNKCVLGIVSQPHVEIYYSQAAADAARISFGKVFSILANKI